MVGTVRPPPASTASGCIGTQLSRLVPWPPVCRQCSTSYAQTRSSCTVPLIRLARRRLLQVQIRVLHFDTESSRNSGTRCHDDDDYEAECRYHWDFVKETVLTTHLTQDADLKPYFTCLGAWARSKEGIH